MSSPHRDNKTASTQSQRELAAPARRADMSDFAQQLRSDPDQARSFFKAAGILSADGQLSASYRKQK